MAVGLLLIFLGWSTPLPPGWYPWTYMAIDIVGALLAPILGGLIASQRPENPYGWLWLGMGMSFALATFTPVYAAYAVEAAPGFAYAAALAGVYALLLFFVSETLHSLLGNVVLVGLYAAIAIAILKHHLYDIDLLINRTLVYGSLTVVFAGIS
jgi:hypothetical protein